VSDAPLTLNAWLRWDVIREHVDRLQPASILELGVGGGAMGSRLAARTRDYVGYEPDPTSRELAKRRLPQGAWLLDDLTALAGRTFDMVCAFEVIEHIGDDREALASWAALVRPEGHLLLSTPAFASAMGPWDHRVGHHRRYDPDQLRALLTDAGMVDIDVRVVGFPLGHALEAARNLVARIRPAPASSMEERTASSGRALQPSGGAAVTRAVTAPFRWIQRRSPDRGTCVVACARHPG
jgi:SAM-dependent methyltransferase